MRARPLNVDCSGANPTCVLRLPNDRRSPAAVGSLAPPEDTRPSTMQKPAGRMCSGLLRDTRGTVYLHVLY
jgi:hypothetical protein